MKDYWKSPISDLEKEFGTSKEGLSSERAKEILQEKGENVLKEGKKETVLQVFLHQFCDLLVIILTIAAIISLVSGNAESTVVIIAVLIMNAILGTVQHVKAQKSLESLKKLSSPSVKVIRDGRKIEISSREVVPGDVVMLEAGDFISADGRVIHSYSLQVNESSLTGESLNIDKEEGVIEGDVALGDRKNMVYSGSLAVYGRAEILVTATGMDTELGKIAGLMNAAKERKTPLQKSLDEFSKKLTILIMIICAVVMALSLYRGMTILDSLMFAVALAVAAIPEALSSIVTIVQALGTQKMAKENAIIKDLKAVESLGCVSVICSDKTGTLTQNKMTVHDVFAGGKKVKAEDIDLEDQLYRYLLYDAVLDNDSSIVDGTGIGDPTEYALLEMFQKIKMKNGSVLKEWGVDEEYIRNEIKRIEEIPFDSDRKLMSIKCEIRGVRTIFTKGAVDVLLDRCTSIWDKNGVHEITEADIVKIKEQNREFSENGLRVLAFAYKESDEELTLGAEENFTFLGLVSMSDPPRPESIEAVANAEKAGIRTVMITGDHKITAVAIAKQIGIFKENDMALTGMELDALTDEELDANIERISVYARVSPENKIRIVEAWQRKGRIVSMTGDGVNDAPALKKADIGVAMGITGTEVSKDAAAMILADDNFATIIKAVANGRNVFRNIKNAIMFLLSGNTAGILAVLYTSLMALPVPFEAVHLLFMNLLTDSLPAIAIGMEPSDDSLLKEKPRDPSVGILTKDFLKKVGIQGTLIAVVTLIAYHVGLKEDAALASTMAFATLTLARLFHGFNCRSERSVYSIKFMSNKYSVMAFGAGVLFLAAVLFITPMHKLFSVVAINSMDLMSIVILAVIPTIIIQVGKILKEASDNRKEK